MRKVESAVVGGGAAGLMAACLLVDSGVPVTVFERNQRLGRKLAITGKGRCNLTNNSDISTVLSNIPTNARFLYSAMNFFPPVLVMSYFEETLGVPLKTERGNRVFPVSDKAKDIVDALEKHVLNNGGRIVKEKVTALRVCDGNITGLHAGQKDYCFEKVLLATGGCSYPLTGSDGQGYVLARCLGHKITTVRPSLVPLECRGAVCGTLQGLSLKNTAITVYDTVKKKKIYEDFGEMLFTHFGVSGPMILSASAHMREMSDGRYEIYIDLKPALDEQTLDRRILSDFEKYKNRDFSNALCDLLPAKLIPVMVSVSGIEPHRKVHEIKKEERRRLCSLLKRFSVTVRGFRPIDEAIITSGGVDVKEIDAKTMESKLVKGLYFAGEILDTDAYTGGFNLQIAFATAALAARAMAEKEG